MQGGFLFQTWRVGWHFSNSCLSVDSCMAMYEGLCDTVSHPWSRAQQGMGLHECCWLLAMRLVCIIMYIIYFMFLLWEIFFLPRLMTP